MTNFSLLKQMCSIHAPSGSEGPMTDFLLNYIEKNKKKWKHQPKIYSGDGFQDCVMLVFGKPRTAIFAHIDNIGFTVRYNKGLVKIGGPRTKNGYELTGQDSKGKIDCTLKVKKDKKSHIEKLEYRAKREIERGTPLSFKPNWRETKTHVQCCYMDNRLGVYNALKVAETLKDGIICFTCYEEHGGGTVSFLQKFIQKNYNVSQALISDITWITEGVKDGKGVALSMRDSLIPRQKYVEKIIIHAKKSKIPFQLEVEGSGGSDAKELQMAEYAWDWIFIGAPEDNVHSPDEKVNKKDIAGMISLYEYLMKEL
ncbi:MAG: aminopeptidase [Bacteroidia bacterium]|nr:aminopeptidase [Bacteroidia bacterium]